MSMAAGSDVRKTAMYSAVYKVLGAEDLHAGNDVVHPTIVLSWQGISLFTSLPRGNQQQERIV